jgi:aspartyl-tRNA(Asn)/glutamyl-tRNA(Gln) amidotransferase subunit A
MKPLHQWDLAEVAGAFAGKTLSPVEYAQALLARIEVVEPRLDAFVQVMAEHLLEQALIAEAAIGRDGPLLPMHGMPVGIKDIIDVAGVATTCHSKFFLDNIATRDAEVVRLLRSAGAIVAGKMGTHEFAIGGPSFDLPFPPARNPWNRDFHPGGSSSGSGTAVGARMLPCAIGTDTGGSVRHPASHCGIVGLKPTYGLVSSEGVFPLAYSLDHVGPMTRTVRDNALVLNAIAGGKSQDYTRELDLGVAGLRIGVIRHFFETDTVATDEVAAAIDAAVQGLATAGAQVRQVRLPPLAEFENVARTILCTEGAAVHEDRLRERPGDFAAFSRQRLLPGLFVSGTDYVQAQRRRAELAKSVDSLFDEVDVLLTSSTMDPAAGMEDHDALVRTFGRQSRMPFNVSGHPAISLMCGLSAQDRLPLSLQMIGRHGGEAALYRAAAGYERLGGWPQVQPPEPA